VENTEIAAAAAATSTEQLGAHPHLNMIEGGESTADNPAAITLQHHEKDDSQETKVILSRAPSLASS